MAGPSPEPGPGLGVFVVINGEEQRCRPESIRKYFLDEVGNCRIVTSSRAFNNDKTFVTLEFNTPRSAQNALSRAGCKVNGCRISASPFRSRNLGNLIGQENRFGHTHMRPGQFNRGGRFQGNNNFNQRGAFQPHFKKGRSWGEQESEKVRGMSPKSAARYIENRIREKEERTQQRTARASSYSRSRSRSASGSRSRSPSYRRRYSSADNSSRSRSRSRSPRRKRKTRRSASRSRSHSSAGSTHSLGRRRQSRSQSASDSDEHQSRERKRRHKKRRRRHHSASGSSNKSDHTGDRTTGAHTTGELLQDIDDWTSHDVLEAAHVTEVTNEEVVPSEVAVLDEVHADPPPAVLPPLPSTQLDLPIPSTLSLPVQQKALQKRHDMQQEFEADVSTIASVTEMLQKHDQGITLQLRNALRSVVSEVTAKYTAEFQDYLNTLVA